MDYVIFTLRGNFPVTVALFVDASLANIPPMSLDASIRSEENWMVLAPARGVVDMYLLNAMVFWLRTVVI